MESEDNHDNLEPFPDNDSVLDDINSLFAESINAGGPENNENIDEEGINELEQQLRTNLLVPNTQKQYNVQLKKFAEYCNHDWNPDVDLPKAKSSV